VSFSFSRGGVFCAHGNHPTSGRDIREWSDDWGNCFLGDVVCGDDIADDDKAPRMTLEIFLALQQELFSAYGWFIRWWLILFGVAGVLAAAVVAILVSARDVMDQI
jgi:hypothetical protein